MITSRTNDFNFIRTAQKKRGIEAAESQLDGIPFEFTNRRNQEPYKKGENSTCLLFDFKKRDYISFICIIFRTYFLHF